MTHAPQDTPADLALKAAADLEVAEWLVGGTGRSESRREHVAGRIQRIIEPALVAAREELDIDRAVCLCSCPAGDHESYGEDGESCQDETHVCLRVAVAVREYVAAAEARESALRADLERAQNAKCSVCGNAQYHCAAVAHEQAETINRLGTDLAAIREERDGLDYGYFMERDYSRYLEADLERERAAAALVLETSGREVARLEGELVGADHEWAQWFEKWRATVDTYTSLLEKERASFGPAINGVRLTCEGHRLEQTRLREVAERERDALRQTTGELCEKCGWRFVLMDGCVNCERDALSLVLRRIGSGLDEVETGLMENIEETAGSGPPDPNPP